MRIKTPCHVKSGSSLEWACAKERMGNKCRLKQDKGTRLVELQRASPGRPPAAPKNEEQDQDSDSDSNQDTEAPTPAQSQASNDNDTPLASKSWPDKLRRKSTKDVEAAMALLQFLRG